MRPIKFRAWDEQRKVMLQEDELGYIQPRTELSPGYAQTAVKKLLVDHKGEAYFLTDSKEPQRAPRLKILLFTSLLDKNGKEIYEGDVVETQSEEKGEVLWHCGAWMKAPIPKEGEYPLLLWQEPILEVIGNIYENPELVE